MNQNQKHTIKRPRKKIIQDYKQDIWNNGGQLPEDVRYDPDPMAVANLDNRLRKVKKHKGRK